MNENELESPHSLLPYSIPAEQSLLGGLMLDNSNWVAINNLVSEKDFFSKENQDVFHAILYLVENRKPVDVITVSDMLDKMGKPRPMGSWLAYVGTIANDTPSSAAASVVTYAEIIRDYSILRQLIHAGKEITNLGFSPKNRQSQELLKEAVNHVLSITASNFKQTSNIVHVKDVLVNVIENIEVMFESDGKNTGLIETGWLDFNEKWGGLPKGLVVIAGRPGMGKSTIAQNITEFFALKKPDSPVIFFTTEMTAEKLVMRMLSSLAKIDYSRISTGKLEDEDWARLTVAVNILVGSKIYIDGTNNLTTVDYHAKIEQFNRDIGKPELIVVDYIQRMDVPELRNNRVGLVSEVSRVLTLSAKELQIPVIGLAQLNRSLESRTDKRPIMSDLRDSGQIEQDADLIIFVYRDEVYNEDSQDKGIAEFIAGKARDNETGKVRLVSNLSQCRFDNYTNNYDND